MKETNADSAVLDSHIHCYEGNSSAVHWGRIQNEICV